MAFTYDETLSTDLALVRFHLADTDSSAYWLEDATITALLSSEGSVGSAVIACIRYIIARLSKPGVSIDWLTVDNETARKAWVALLAEKRAEFGVGQITATARHTYRADSTQTSAPDYSDGV